ncbi:MAG: ATPase, T2SS/T4P/T4SS family [Patulibacter minatonensis]
MSDSTHPQPVNGAEAAAAAAASAMSRGVVDPLGGASVVTHPGAAGPAGYHDHGDGQGATIHQLPGTTSGWVPTPRRRLGDIVVDAMWVPRTVVEEMVDEARQLGRPIGQLLLDRGLLTSEQLGQAIAERFGLPYLTLRQTEIEIAAATMIDAQTARRLRALPIAFDDDTLVVAMVDPGNIVALDDIAMLTGQRVRPLVVADEDLDLVIQRVLGVDSEVGAVLEQIDDVGSIGQDELDDLRETTDDEGPTVKIVQSVLSQAVERRASDVHFDPTPEGLKVRFRIDGVVHEVTSVPRQLSASVVSRLKILAELNIAERRMPQDGRVGFAVDGRRIDLRVVTLPLVDGESVVLRVLDSGGTVRGLHELGMRADAEAKLARALSRSSGGILATGPTGSGKTTTVYGALQKVNTGDRTIITIEDPVEYRVPGVKQLQINPKIGLEFSTGLRAMVRADPDVMLVGEIRDGDSAQIAMQAAITGHLVLSTLHTNNAATALSRLVDMGVPSFMVVSAVTCVVGQRLARRLCEHCKEPGHVPAEILGGEPGTEVGVFNAVGCPKCNDTGYDGRIGLYEVLEVSDEIRRLVVTGAGADQIQVVARAEGMQTMREDAIERVREGLTSVDELARVAAV